MNATKIETTIQVDGELHLTKLPVRRGDRVEAILLRLEESTDGKPPEPRDAGAAEKLREAARQEFLALAKSSAFHSTRPYPTREELHERH